MKSMPMRLRGATKYDFLERDVLPFACGTLKGTISLIKYFFENEYYKKDEFLLVVVDYDLYWRIFKLLCSNSICGSFPSLKKRLILIQGPWHIYKMICEATWEIYSPLLLARIWQKTFNTPVPEKPPLKKILFFYLSLISTSRRNRKWKSSGNTLSRLIQILIYELIPLVSLIQ